MKAKPSYYFLTRLYRCFKITYIIERIMSKKIIKDELDSVKIAELRGEQHDDVIRDPVNHLIPEQNLNWYCEIERYVDSNGSTRVLHRIVNP